jgi:hypothetical protein
MTRTFIMSEVFGEMERQDTKWGIQDHTMHYWNTIITEELGESAQAIFDVENVQNFSAARAYTAELVHVAACAIQAIANLRAAHPEWDPEIEPRQKQKASAPRAKIKGQIVGQALPAPLILDDPDDFLVTHAAQERVSGS